MIIMEREKTLQLPTACLALTTATAAVCQRSLEQQGSLKKYCVNKKKKNSPEFYCLIIRDNRWMKRDANHFAIIMPKVILRKDFKHLTNLKKCFQGEQGE